MMTFPFPLAADIIQRIRTVQSSARVTIPLAVSTEWTTVTSYQFSSAERGYILGFGYAVDDPLYDYNGSILFRVVIDSQPIQDFSSLQLQIGTVQAPAPTMFYLQPTNLISLQARRAVVAAADQSVSATFRGIGWPQKYCLPFND
jgi:hypothetical protein